MSIFWQMGQKDGDFLFWLTPEARANGYIFRVKKSHISLWSSFLDTLYSLPYKNEDV